LARSFRKVTAVREPGFDVARGQIATIEIGVEVKILQKAMIKQIDRVTTTLIDQALHFRSRGGQPICVAVVGINQADYTVSFEGEMTWRTDGKKHKHPIQEAAEAERRLVARAAPHFDEFIILRYSATNEPPYTFQWRDERNTELDYGASLVRISREYEQRA
jgi:hypothetical protein